MSKHQPYRTVVHLKLVTHDVVEVRPAAAAFTIYRRTDEIPEAYHGLLQDKGECWTFARTEIGADYPEEMTLTFWETENVSTKEEIDESWQQLLASQEQLQEDQG